MTIKRRLDRIEEVLRQRGKQATDAAVLAGQAALLDRIEAFGVWFDHDLDDDHAPPWIASNELPARRALARRAIELYDEFPARVAGDTYFGHEEEIDL